MIIFFHATVGKRIKSKIFKWILCHEGWIYIQFHFKSVQLLRNVSRFATYDEFPDMEFKKVKIIKKTKVGEAKPTRNKNKFYYFFDKIYLVHIRLEKTSKWRKNQFGCASNDDRINFILRNIIIRKKKRKHTQYTELKRNEPLSVYSTRLPWRLMMNFVLTRICWVSFSSQI